jgi:hypothetical protein
MSSSLRPGGRTKTSSGQKARHESENARMPAAAARARHRCVRVRDRACSARRVDLMGIVLCPSLNELVRPRMRGELVGRTKFCIAPRASVEDQENRREEAETCNWGPQTPLKPPPGRRRDRSNGANDRRRRGSCWNNVDGRRRHSDTTRAAAARRARLVVSTGMSRCQKLMKRNPDIRSLAASGCSRARHEPQLLGSPN